MAAGKGGELSKTAVLFDLDGTLVDTAADLAVSMNHALSAMGHEAMSASEVRHLVGYGARRMIMRGAALPFGILFARLFLLESVMKKQIFAATKALLPLKVRNAFFHFGFNVARNEFDKFAYQYAFAPNMPLALKAAKSRGLDAKTIVDVGAFEGNWSRMVKEIWPDARITMIEANDQKASILEPIAKQLGARLEFALLGATPDQQVDFYVMESGSSVFEERSTFDRHKISKNTKTLDEILNQTSPVDLLKLDTQGFELEILKGATNTLATTHAVLMEVSLIEINKGAPLIHDVIAFMKARDFVTHDILEFHRRHLDGATNQIDILFLREGSPLLSENSFN